MATLTLANVKPKDGQVGVTERRMTQTPDP
jgi:hypothetical protein